MIHAKRWLLNTPVNLGLTLLLFFLAACGSTETPRAPAAASGVTAEPGPGYITVSWQDNSDNETGFEIHRMAAGGVTAQQSGEPLATVGANQTSYVDLDVDLEQEYDYSVTAVNATGSASAAAASSGAAVAIGVDLMVGTNNRRWTEDSNGTIFVVYFVFPQAMLDDVSDDFLSVISGPPGWNGGNNINFTCTSTGCDRSKGFAVVSLNDFTAVPGEYSVTVTAGGQDYEASATLSDELYKFPRATDIVVSNASASGATVNWTAAPGTKSHSILLHHGEYNGYIDGWAAGPETTFTIDDQSLADGIYGVEVVAWNSDILNYPLKVEPFGLSYEIEVFGVGAIHSADCASASEVISLPDAALQQAVRDELGIASGDITCADMALITTLDAADAGIVSLEGLQYAPNLGDLFLHGNDVSDVSPLANLTELWALNLNLNEVTDVSPLENLTNLTELHLCCTTGKITDVTALEGMTKMVGLNLTGHELGDATIWPLLDNYPDLRRLWIGESNITDLSNLASHPDLQVLQISDSEVTDLSYVADLTQLVELQLQWSTISDLTPVHTMTHLLHLNLSGLGLTDIGFLEDFGNLSSLSLSFNELTSLAPLVANPGLGSGDWVDVSDNLLDLNDPDVQADIQTLLDRGVDLDY